MSTASLLVLALAGLLLVTFPSLCGSSAAHGINQCRGAPLLGPRTTGYACGECCKPGQIYQTYRCSPPVTGNTRAIMTLKDFDNNIDGAGPSQCVGPFPNNTQHVVALSTGWYDKGKRCGKNIRIRTKGKSVLAKVVAECDSLHGCGAGGDYGYQPPCGPRTVGASQAVWDALDITGDEVRDEYPITWSMSDA